MKSILRNETVRAKAEEFLSLTGMSQKRFSESVGYSGATINAWIAGKRTLPTRGLDLIEIFLDKYGELLANLKK